MRLITGGRDETKSLDPELPVSQVGTVESRFATAVAQPRSEPALERANLRHRQLGIERLNLVSDSGNETHGVGGIRSYRKKRIPGVRLGQWLVDRGLYRIRQPRVFHVSYDTDNLSLSRDALGRASCRERVWMLVVAGTVKKK